MPDYRRNGVPAETFFFTVNLLDRRSNLLVTNIDAVRECAPAYLSYRRLGRPPRPHALSVDVAEGDADFPGRWRAFKTGLANSLPIGEPRSPVMTRRGERGIWQRRYWEHTIRDDRDFAGHVDYSHFNPVKHGLVAHPADWPHSSFRRCVASGIYPADWGVAVMNRNRLANGSEIEAAEAARATRPLHWPRAPIHKSRWNALRCSACAC